MFLIATALCALAQSSVHLIGFRVLQGAAAGIVVSSEIALLTTYYEDFCEKIAFVMAIGPVLGGIASDYASWRFVFAICTPLVGLATLLLYLSPLKNKSQAVYHDYRVLISVTAFSLLVASMSLLMDARFGSQNFLLFCGASTFFFALVLYRQFFSPYLVVDPGLMRQKKYLMVTALGSVSNISLLTVSYLFPLSLQAYWGLSLAHSSVSFCAVAIMVGLGGDCSGRISLSREISVLVGSFCAASILFYVLSFDVSLILY